MGRPTTVFLALALSTGPVSGRADQTAGAALTPAQTAFAGTWDYNDDYSVNAATGKPEQSPRSATQRATGGGGVATRPPGGVSASNDEFERQAMAAFAAERRMLIRDLLEVPEKITIRVTPASATFVDDLDRERTYLTTKTQKYQLGAAQFEARIVWDGTRLRKEIEAANGFQMTETYFLSEDGRLIVVLRIGDPKKPETQFGVNRVYDRIK